MRNLLKYPMKFDEVKHDVEKHVNKTRDQDFAPGDMLPGMLLKLLSFAEKHRNEFEEHCKIKL